MSPASDSALAVIGIDVLPQKRDLAHPGIRKPSGFALDL